MVYLQNNSRILLGNKMLLQIPVNKISKYIDSSHTSKEIRKKFLDYFINEKNHTFVKSSPVIPYCDPSVAFVNAGMNQFKSVFTGKQQAQFKKVANSQKCIRVGGKHNDLNVVGSDGYHHTFFEMLGNWSFGDYFKKEACQMAWDLLTKEYKLPAKHLYVTYFGGDKLLGISEDLETKEIWKSIGLPNNRILPFKMKDNFWEMGPTGPCGPCTEIHFDHLGATNRAQFVNKGLHDLTELWNIVFIQYNRNEDSTLTSLAENHVDTGMGFERLTAVLQGKISNYDTDNFSYIIKALHKICRNVPKYKGRFGEIDWNNLDTSYRILCDHSRMITVCLSDGIIPEQNQKLRRVLRKALLLCETTFQKEKGLLKELSNYVVEHLGTAYPEMEKNILQIHKIIEYEEEVYKNLRNSASPEWNILTKDNPELLSLDVIETPNVIAAFREIKKANTNVIDENLAFKLYDALGIDKELMLKLSQILKLKYDPASLDKKLQEAKTKSKEAIFLKNSSIIELLKDKMERTDDSYKYLYTFDDNKYTFEKLRSKIVGILVDDKLVNEVDCYVKCSLLLDKTNLYTESGGQVCDQGAINFGGNIFEVLSTENLDGYILHNGLLYSDNKSDKLSVGMWGTTFVDPTYRTSTMCNHTATHLLNAAIKKEKGVTSQKSSKVTNNFLNLDLGIFGDKLSMDEVTRIENSINELINSAIPVNVSEVNSQQLLNLNNVTVVPGEIYPDTGIRLVEIIAKDNFISREPCCGTHLLNVAHMKDFCIIGLKSLGRSTASIYAVTGERAVLAKKNGAEISDEIANLQKSINENLDKPEMLEVAVAALKYKLTYNMDDNSILPIVVKQACLEKLNDISKQIKSFAKKNLKEFIEIEMMNVLESNVKKTKSDRKYIVHYLRSSMIMDSVPLQRATKLCPDLPVLIVSYADNMVKARCCVPKNLTNDKFNAQLWLKETVADIFKAAIAPPQGQDASVVCNMKAKKVNLQDWDTLLNESLEAAKIFIDERL